MDELLDRQQLNELLQSVQAWFFDDVVAISNLVQLALIAVAFALAYFFAARVSGWLDKREWRPAIQKLAAVFSSLSLPMIWLVFQWLAIAIATGANWPHHFLEVVASLLTAWVVIRMVSQLVRNPVMSHSIAWTVWIIAALNILNLLEPTIQALDAAAITLGEARISLYTVAKSTLALALLLWIAIYLATAIESRIRTSEDLSPSLKVLISKSLKIVLITLAIIVAIRSVGIDLTALAVLGGAIGLGIGFGLQKIIANLISGVILLLDKSIKPGDVIAVEQTYGWVNTLGGRYVSVITRDGTEHLIPNETLITERVENWTHSDNRTRVKVPVGVHYQSDVKKAIDLCLESATSTDRVLESPKPVCLLKEFGDNSVNLELRFWIEDAQKGLANVRSQVLLKIWDKFHEHEIEIPYPQRDLHLRSPEQLLAAMAKTA